MTIDKRDKVTIPVWVLSLIISLVIAGATTWGIVSARSAATEVRLDHIEKNQAQKVDRDEFQMVCDELKEIKRILMKDRM